MNKTVIIVLAANHSFRDEINEIIRAIHGGDSGPEGVSDDIQSQLIQINNRLDVITERINKMADDFSKLEEAQAANAKAIDDAVTEITDLFTKIGQTPPSNQPEIDRLTAAFNEKTAALAAVAKAPTPTV